MSEELERFSPESFQDLVAVLLMGEFGPAVQKMGRGPDGGRDITLTLENKSGQDAPPGWSGYTVFQVKHKASTSAQGPTDARWVRERVREEIAAWTQPGSRRGRIPDAIVIVTNVRLTPVSGNGGYDSVIKEIESHLELMSERVLPEDLVDKYMERVEALRRATWRVWDGNQLQALIDKNEAVRRAFPAFMTAADVFSYMSAQTNIVGIENLIRALGSHARSTFLDDGNVYFDEAGAVDGTGYPLHKVIVDLPLLDASADGSTSLLAAILARSEHMLRPGITTHTGATHLIVAGAPGNGKTTMSRFIVQAFRAAVLEGSQNLSRHQVNTISEIRRAFERMKLDFPRNRRWPIHLDLSTYKETSNQEYPTILQWIASVLEEDWDYGSVAPTALKDLLATWPCLVVLDGLDEVTDPATRKRIIQRMTTFVEDAEAEGGDVLVLLTTRPMGYSEEIAPQQFERLDLGIFKELAAIEYGEKATRVRLGHDEKRIAKIVARLRASAEDPQRAHLMRTPLQILMLTIILDGGRDLPPYRYGLFYSYYLAVRSREQAKHGPSGELLREHENLIDRVHELAGFSLQCRNEEAEFSNAGLDDEDLLEVTWAALDEYGYDPGGVDSGLVRQIKDATTNRLVLLSPRPRDGELTFDVRSLQELMAARALTHASWATSQRLLRIAAPSPHWRNTWIFAAGRMFFESRPEPRNRVTSLVESIDVGAHERLSTIAPVGPSLALDLIDDGMSRNAPRWRDRILVCALRVFSSPQGSDLPRLLSMVLRLGDAEEAIRPRIVEGLIDALSGDSVATDSARRTIGILQDDARSNRLGPTGHALLQERDSATALVMSPSGWPRFNEVIEEAISGDQAPELLRECARLTQKAGHAFLNESERIQLADLVTDPSISRPLDQALTFIADQYPAVVSELRRPIFDTVHRAPIAQLLIDELTHDQAE